MFRDTFSHVGCATLLGLAAIGAAHAAGPDNRDLSRLLDPDTPRDERTTEFEAFRHSALAGSSYAQYVVGSLYRAGDRLPHGFVRTDPDEAVRYLSTAAAHGYLNAMTKMAEIEFGRGHYIDAMVWAQLYAHYSGAAGNTDEAGHIKPNEFLAGLLHRLYDHVDDVQMDEVGRDVAAFVDAHDADVRAGIGTRARPSTPADAAKKPALKFHRPPTDVGRTKTDTQADYLVAFDPEGHPQNAWLLDALPDMHTGVELKSMALRLHMTPKPSAPPLRYSLVPVRVTNKEFSLRDSS